MVEKERMEKARKMRIVLQPLWIKGHIKDKCWRKIFPKCLRNSKARVAKRKAQKMGAAVEEEHPLLFVNLCDKVILAEEHKDHDDDVGPLISIDETTVHLSKLN